jgi:hypothetical protein
MTRLLPLVLFVMVNLVGCSSKYQPVHGLVTYADGQPVPEGTIEFEFQAEKLRDRLNAVSAIQPDGRFVLSTQSQGDGALAGDHRVAIFPPVRLPPDAGQPAPPPFRSFPAKYSNYDTSNLTVTVKPGRNEFTFVLK